MQNLTAATVRDHHPEGKEGKEAPGGGAQSEGVYVSR